MLAAISHAENELGVGLRDQAREVRKDGRPGRYPLQRDAVFSETERKSGLLIDQSDTFLCAPGFG